MLGKLLFRIAKAPLMGRIVGLAFQRCPWALPVKKIYCNRDVLAFDHPRPSYENHIIISPRKPVRSLRHMTSCDLMKIWDAAGDIRAAHPAYHGPFTLVANGGKKQEVQQVHFHMFTHHDMVRDAQGNAEIALFHDEDTAVWEHPDPDWDIHAVLKPMAGAKRDCYFRSVLHSMDQLDASFHLAQRGYSLVCQSDQANHDAECPVFHIISGRKTQEARSETP